MSEYYDWQKTLSYNADVTVVVASRGRGKTYGIRKEAIKDYVKRGGLRFVEVVRCKSEMSGVMDGYFDRLQYEFPDHIFRVANKKGWIAKKTQENEKPEWDCIMYFVAITDSQNAKKRTYNNVKKIIFDEAVLDPTDSYHHYSRDEYYKLANIVDTVSRERADNNSCKPHLYLLANACDLMNPYFIQYGINKIPSFGYKWFNNKSVIVHYEDPGEYADDKLAGTVSGRMISGTREGSIAARNEFVVKGEDLIADKPPNAKFLCGFVSSGKEFGVWSDNKEGYIYINEKIVADASYDRVFSVRNEDLSINRVAAYSSQNTVKALIETARLSLIRYSSYSVKEDFLSILSLFGY